MDKTTKKNGHRSGTNITKCVRNEKKTTATTTHTRARALAVSHHLELCDSAFIVGVLYVNHSKPELLNVSQLLPICCCCLSSPSFSLSFWSIDWHSIFFVVRLTYSGGNICSAINADFFISNSTNLIAQFLHFLHSILSAFFSPIHNTIFRLKSNIQRMTREVSVTRSNSSMCERPEDRFFLLLLLLRKANLH